MHFSKWPISCDFNALFDPYPSLVLPTQKTGQKRSPHYYMSFTTNIFLILDLLEKLRQGEFETNLFPVIQTGISTYRSGMLFEDVRKKEDSTICSHALYCEIHNRHGWCNGGIELDETAAGTVPTWRCNWFKWWIEEVFDLFTNFDYGNNQEFQEAMINDRDDEDRIKDGSGFFLTEKIFMGSDPGCGRSGHGRWKGRNKYGDFFRRWRRWGWFSKMRVVSRATWRWLQRVRTRWWPWSGQCRRNCKSGIGTTKNIEEWIQ